MNLFFFGHHHNLFQIPLVGLERHRGSWANLTIDVVGLTAVCFKADDFRTLDLLAIGPTCRLRKVFTMKGALDDSSGAGGEDDHGELLSAGASGVRIGQEERCRDEITITRFIDTAEPSAG